jgi:hypothetical protein
VRPTVPKPRPAHRSGPDRYLNTIGVMGGGGLPRLEAMHGGGPTYTPHGFGKLYSSRGLPVSSRAVFCTVPEVPLDGTGAALASRVAVQVSGRHWRTHGAAGSKAHTFGHEVDKATVNADVAFLHHPPLDLLGLWPRTGPATGDTLVTLKLLGLQIHTDHLAERPVACMFGDAVVQGFFEERPDEWTGSKWMPVAHVKCVSPPNPAGIHDVKVSLDDQLFSDSGTRWTQTVLLYDSYEVSSTVPYATPLMGGAAASDGNEPQVCNSEQASRYWLPRLTAPLTGRPVERRPTMMTKFACATPETLSAGAAIAINGRNLSATARPASEIMCRWYVVVADATHLDIPAIRMSNELLLCEAPPNPNSGETRVDVALNGQQYDSGTPFFYYDTPTVTGLGPKLMAVGAAPVTITIRGERISQTGLFACIFGEFDTLTWGAVVNDTMATCEAPTRWVAGPVSVQASLDGQLFADTGVVLDYTPTIASIAPAHAVTALGTVVTVSGVGFDPNHQRIECVFGDLRANVRTTAYYVDNTTVRCATPREMWLASPASPGFAGTGAVELTVIADTAFHGPRDSATFTFHAAPHVTSVSPSVAEKTAGEAATVRTTVSAADVPRIWTGLIAARQDAGLDSRDPARSCADILAFHGGTEAWLLANGEDVKTGTYWLHPWGQADPEHGLVGDAWLSKPFQVFCDMETDGGGWAVLATEALDEAGAVASEGVVAAQMSNADPWTKCKDDAAQYYDWLTENDRDGVTNLDAAFASASAALDVANAAATAAAEDYTFAETVEAKLAARAVWDNATSLQEELVPHIFEQTLTRTIRYVNPTNRKAYTAAQLEGLRLTATDINLGTRMVVASTGGNTVSVSVGAETLLLTPGETGGSCNSGGRLGFQRDDSAFYVWHGDAYDSLVSGVLSTDLNAELLGAASGGTNFLLPDAVSITLTSRHGGGAAFGWGQAEIRLRPLTEPALLIEPDVTSRAGMISSFAIPDLSSNPAFARGAEVFVQMSLDGQHFSADRQTMVIYDEKLPPTIFRCASRGALVF